MPELGILQPRGLPVLQFQPLNPASYFDRTTPQALPIDTSRLSKADANSAVMGLVTKTLSELPNTIVTGLRTGRKLREEGKGIDLRNRAIAGTLTKDEKAALEDMTIGPGGEMTYKAPSPFEGVLRDLQVKNAQQTLTNKTPVPNAAASILPVTPQAASDPADDPATLGALEELPASGQPTTPFIEEPKVVTNGNNRTASIADQLTSRIDAGDGYIGDLAGQGKVWVPKQKSPGDPPFKIITKETQEKQTPSENALDRAIIARSGNPLTMTLEQKEEYLKQEAPLKPSDKLSAIRDLRSAHDQIPSKILIFGKGQMPGLHNIMEKMDEIKKDSGGDFSKMSPQQGRTIVFQFNKFNDPNSAVLLSEYKAATDTLGIPDQVWRVINKAGTGESILPEQARDIYSTVKSAYDRAKDSYKQDAADIVGEADRMGISPVRLGIPNIVKDWIKEPTTSGTQAEVKSQPDGNAILKKYQSGAYDSDPARKAKAEELLRRAGLL